VKGKGLSDCSGFAPLRRDKMGNLEMILLNKFTANFYKKFNQEL